MGIALLVGSTGCEHDENQNRVEDVGDTVAFDAADGTAEPAGEPMKSWRYVRILDVLPDAAADIDALVLDKSGGGQFYAERVVHYLGVNDHVPIDYDDPSQVLGPPDTFDRYPDTSSCPIEPARYVELGDDRAYLVVEMGAAIEEGDRLTVLEIGGCDWGEGEAIPETVEVSIADSHANLDPFDGDWTVLGTGGGPITFEIPALERR